MHLTHRKEGGHHRWNAAVLLALLDFLKPLIHGKDVTGKSDRTLKPGDICKGIVSGIANFGVFLNLDGVTGFVSTANLSWERFTDVSQVIQVGREVNVVVLGEDIGRDQLQLSIKGLSEDPLQKFAREEFGNCITGSITKLTPIGLFVSVRGDLEGLVPRSGLVSAEHDGGGNFDVGKEVNVKVVGINLISRQILLSLMV